VDVRLWALDLHFCWAGEGEPVQIVGGGWALGRLRVLAKDSRWLWYGRKKMAEKRLQLKVKRAYSDKQQ
jgi:hypothetical protein